MDSDIPADSFLRHDGTDRHGFRGHSPSCSQDSGLGKSHQGENLGSVHSNTHYGSTSFTSQPTRTLPGESSPQSPRGRNTSLCEKLDSPCVEFVEESRVQEEVHGSIRGGNDVAMGEGGADYDGTVPGSESHDYLKQVVDTDRDKRIGERDRRFELGQSWDLPDDPLPPPSGVQAELTTSPGNSPPSTFDIDAADYSIPAFHGLESTSGQEIPSFVKSDHLEGRSDHAGGLVTSRSRRHGRGRGRNSLGSTGQSPTLVAKGDTSTDFGPNESLSSSEGSSRGLPAPPVLPSGPLPAIACLAEVG